MQNPNLKNILLVGLVAVVVMCVWVNWGDRNVVKNEIVSEKCEGYRKEFSSVTGVDFTASINNFTDIENINTVETTCELKYENDTTEDDFQSKLSSKIFSYFTDNSWQQNNNAAAGGVDGEIYGFDKNGDGVVVSLHSNRFDLCPDDEPVGNCNVSGKTAHHVALIHFGKSVPENVISGNIMSTYTNDKYGFSLKYPENYVLTLPPDSSIACNVIDRVDEKGLSYTHAESIDVLPASEFPMSFLEALPVSGEDPSLLLNGFLGYKLLPKCSLETIVFLRVYNKPVGMSTDSFLARATKTENDGVAGGASGGYAELVQMDAGGKLVPVVHSADGSVMQNSSDTYYFEKGNYMYALSFSYSQSALGDSEISPDYTKQEIYKYNFAKGVVSSFSFVTPAASGISGSVINRSCGGALMMDPVTGEPVDTCHSNPFASFEMKIVNDATHVEKIVTADSQGKFYVDLPVGNYTIKKGDKYGAALSGNDYHVEVKKDQVSNIEMQFGYLYP